MSIEYVTVEEGSNTVPVGLVIRTDPASPTELPTDGNGNPVGTITIYVSLGPLTVDLIVFKTIESGFRFSVI